MINNDVDWIAVMKEPASEQPIEIGRFRSATGAFSACEHFNVAGSETKPTYPFLRWTIDPVTGDDVAVGTGDREFRIIPRMKKVARAKWFIRDLFRKAS